MVYLKGHELIREIPLNDVTAVHATKCGSCYVIGFSQGEIQVYDSARLTLKKTINTAKMAGNSIKEITSNLQFCVFTTDQG